MTGPAIPPPAAPPAVRGKFGPALHFTVPAAPVPVVPLPADGENGTCHVCREKFPLAALEEMGSPAGALACKDYSGCWQRKTKATRAPAAASGSAA